MSTAIKIKNLRKKYTLGAIGGKTLNAELQSWWAKVRGKEDPNLKLGQKTDHYGETFWALDGINLEIQKGEAIGIIGSNGAGKSTLLKILSRVTAPTEGDVWIDGRIASMLEVGTGFHRELTGRENIYMNGAILGMTKKEVDAKIESIIEFSECRQFIDTPVKRYSSGMYVKLAFAVASHLDAEIMVMDEVLAVGDMRFQKKCLDKMRDEANGGKTVLYVSHNMATIRQLCTRCIVLDHGRVICDSDVETAINTYLNVSVSAAIEKDLSSIERLDYIKNNNIKFTRAKYKGQSDIIFKRNTPIQLELDWIVNEDVENVGMRVVVYDRQGAHICAAFLYDLCSGKKGDQARATLELDVSALAPGDYQSYYVFFAVNEFGGTEDFDQVRGLDFTIDDPERVGKLAWRTNAWGHVELPTPKVIGMRAL